MEDRGDVDGHEHRVNEATRRAGPSGHDPRFVERYEHGVEPAIADGERVGIEDDGDPGADPAQGEVERRAMSDVAREAHRRDVVARASICGVASVDPLSTTRIRVAAGNERRRHRGHLR